MDNAGKGNIKSLVNLLANFPCWAIPLGNVKNEKRSLIFIDNLVSAIISSVEDKTETSRLFWLGIHTKWSLNNTAL